MIRQWWHKRFGHGSVPSLEWPDDFLVYGATCQCGLTIYYSRPAANGIGQAVAVPLPTQTDSEEISFTENGFAINWIGKIPAANTTPVPITEEEKELVRRLQASD